MEIFLHKMRFMYSDRFRMYQTFKQTRSNMLIFNTYIPIPCAFKMARNFLNDFLLMLLSLFTPNIIEQIFFYRER